MARRRIPLPQLAGKLVELTGSPPPGGYRQLYMLVTGGRAPFIESEGGRYFVRDADLPRVAELLGLTIKDASPAGGKTRAAA
jgi:hypothetical protein